MHLQLLQRLIWGWGTQISVLLETARILHTDLVKMTAPQEVWQDTLCLAGTPHQARMAAEITNVHCSLAGGKPEFGWNPLIPAQQLTTHSSQYKKINYWAIWSVAHVHTWKYSKGASKDTLGRERGGGAGEAECCPEKEPTAVFVSLLLPVAFHKQCLGEKAPINVNNCSLLDGPWPICKLTKFLNYICL